LTANNLVYDINQRLEDRGNLYPTRLDLKVGNDFNVDTHFVLKPFGTAGTHTASAWVGLTTNIKIAEKPFIVYPKGEVPTVTPVPTLDPFCDVQCVTSLGQICSGSCARCPTCAPKVSPMPIPELKPLCDQMSDDKLRISCWECMSRTDASHIWTALGCLPTNLSALIKEYIFTTVSESPVLHLSSTSSTAHS